MHEPASRTLVGDPPDWRELEAAARLLGIENEYWDVWGRRHAASPEAQTAILASLGVNAVTQESLGQALEERELRQWRKPLPPTIVFTEDQPPHEVMLSLPAERSDSPAVLEIRFEDGSSLRLPVELGAIPVTASKQVDGRPLVRKSLKLPDALPLGYHELTLELAGERSPAARLIVCPSRAYHPEWLEAGRAAGLAISLFGLRSERNWGCGDITDLKAVIDWAAEHAGADFIALNPLHAIPNRQ